MSGAVAGWLQAGLLVVALAVSFRPLGDYMARILTAQRHWRAERGLYRVMGVDPDADQRWSTMVARRAFDGDISPITRRLSMT